ncbi:MAG: DUF4012 domain-containing protein, partial [Actinobacteria bacterium]|nr:DUF4012 domain-containing protein [Actinomycetota bacterium]
VAANRHLSSLLVKLVYPIPVVSQHAQMAVAASSSGSAITSTAARAATVAPYQRLRTSDGAFDVEKIASMERPVENTITAMHDANARVDRTNSPWLLGPLRNRVSAYQKQLDRAVPQAQRALDAIRIAPEVLGGNGPRHYLLLFGNPAETRGLGGFVGAWAQLDATDGQLTLVRHGKMGDLNDATPWESRHITGEPEYMARYGALQPARYIQNISASPDFPTVARVAEQLYPQAGGIPVDGVMYIDPRGLAALLKLTGPVTVQDAPEKLTSANAARFLMHDQYVKVPGLGDRTDLLSNAAEATFKALTNRRLPTVSMITSVLSPAMHDLHIMATVNDPEANTYFTSIGLTGAFPKVKRKDFVSVRISNIGENKMDYFVNQASLYSVRHDVANGSTQGTLTTLIQNVGPESGLPDYVAGNPDTRAHRTNGRPYGSANVAVSIYTALQPTGMTIGGRPVGIQVQHELGYWVASVSTTVPEGVTNVLVLEVSGTIAPSADYHLVVANQPIATFPGTMVTYHPYDSRHRGARPQPPRVFFKPSGVYVFGPDGGSRWTN